MNMIGMPKALEQNMGDLTEITDPADWPEMVNSDAGRTAAPPLP